MHETSDDFFSLYNNLFIYQVLCTLIYRRRSLYYFLYDIERPYHFTESLQFRADSSLWVLCTTNQTALFQVAVYNKQHA